MRYTVPISRPLASRSRKDAVSSSPRSFRAARTASCRWTSRLPGMSHDRPLSWVISKKPPPTMTPTTAKRSPNSSASTRPGWRATRAV